MYIGSCSVAAQRFQGANGDTEHTITVEAPPHLAFEDQLRAVEGLYVDTLCGLGLEQETAVFRRVFVSDLLNQAPRVQASALLADPAGSPVAVSVVQQRPVQGAKVALLAYHIDSAEPLQKRRLANKHVLVEKRGLGHLWSTRLCAGSQDRRVSAADQTRTVFEDLVGTLAGQGGNLRDHCVRTWLYIRDVDVFYQEMVESRTELFLREGLTGDTHYIASTGIEGGCSHKHDVVLMDAYSVLGMRPEQMSFLNDFRLMCPTKDYNVTFERGTRIGYADRAHHFISGTASIDNTGTVLHLGDVTAQLDRALVNVDGILSSGGAGLEDLMYLLVYLRDPSDLPAVQARLRERLPSVPALMVHGPVCRPEWLIEIEGVAISRDHRPDLPSF
ncbi:MAG: Rid family hydrolase [Magnetospirillum sp.]|nr:Rid family hydrolase [Magnetospirillum sp.]